MSGNCGLWAPRLISATDVYILSTYELIFIAVNTKTMSRRFQILHFRRQNFQPASKLQSMRAEREQSGKPSGA